MLVSIYRSSKKDEMYLYIERKDDFSRVPEDLLKAFGRPEFAMQINLEKRARLARADIREVKAQLQEQGYYLQMPPVTQPVEEMDIAS